VVKLCEIVSNVERKTTRILNSFFSI